MQLCPNCGAVWSVGAVCPTCNTALTARLPWRWLRYGVLALALVGLGWLFYAWQGVPVPRRTLAQLAQNPPLGFVEVAGTVARLPHYDLTTGQLTFWLTDPTASAGGQIPVVVAGAATETLSQTQGWPQLGDQVTLAGVVQWQNDTPSLYLNTATAFSRTVPTPHALMLAALSRDLELQAVEVLAQVVAVRQTSTGMITVLLKDESGQGVVAWETQNGGMLPALSPGDVVQVVGVVTLYQDTPQITLRTMADLHVLPADTPLPSTTLAPTTLTPLGQLRVGGMAKVVGVITDVTSLPFGFAFTLADASGTAQLVVRDDVYTALTDAVRLQRGAQVQAFGLVRLVQGQRQLTPETAEALQVLASGAAPTQTTAIATLGLAQVGQTVTVAGTVVTTQPFGAGQRFTLQDATGQLTIQLWETLQPYLPSAAQWSLGQPLQATGRLEADDGQLILVPQLGSDVVLQK